jgi:diacylglycerol kinase (ATP)
MSVPRISLRERLSRRPGNGSGSVLVPGAPRRRISIVESFNFAVEGIIHALRTHRNMRVHFAAAVAVLVAALALGVERIELIVLLISIAFVLVAEMINTAIEAAIDVATSSFDPLAKLAKDIAAGAVLIASINAVVVGYLVFSGQVSEPTSDVLDRLRDAPATVTIIALILVVFAVIATKALTGRGTPLRGGLPSGHAAVAFAGWMAVTEVLGPSEHRFLVSSIMFAVAVLVAHSRIESGIHSGLEVLYGSLLGAIVTLAVFQIF